MTLTFVNPLTGKELPSAELQQTHRNIKGFFPLVSRQLLCNKEQRSDGHPYFHTLPPKKEKNAATRTKKEKTLFFHGNSQISLI